VSSLPVDVDTAAPPTYRPLTRIRSLIRIDTFVLFLLLALALATLVPAHGVGADVMKVMTRIATAVLFLLYGARLSADEAWHGVRQWRLHALVLAFTFVVFPLLGLAAGVLVPVVLSPDLFMGLLFLTVVPSTVQSSIAFTSIARGNVAAAMVSASLSNLLGVVLTPLLVVLLMDTTEGVGVHAGVVLNIVLQLLVPFLVGQLLRPWIAKWVSRHPVLTRVVDRGLILLVVYSAFSLSMTGHIWAMVGLWQIVAVAVLCAILLAVVLLLTAGVGRVAGLSRGDRAVLLFCGSKKSLASGLPIALALSPNATAGLIMLPLMLFHQIQLLVCAVIANRMSRDPAVAEDHVA
jgi:solute carrier family 10 (sodium/bile acid cotransporter), member 7